MPWIVFYIAHSFCSPKDRLLKTQLQGMDVIHKEGRWEQLATNTEQMRSTERTAPDQKHAIPWKNAESNNQAILSGS